MKLIIAFDLGAQSGCTYALEGTQPLTWGGTFCKLLKYCRYLPSAKEVEVVFYADNYGNRTIVSALGEKRGRVIQLLASNYEKVTVHKEIEHVVWKWLKKETVNWKWNNELLSTHRQEGKNYSLLLATMVARRNNYDVGGSDFLDDHNLADSIVLFYFFSQRREKFL